MRRKTNKKKQTEKRKRGDSIKEIKKEGEDYSVLTLNDLVCPIDAVILPLFDKDGMGKIANEITKKANALVRYSLQFGKMLMKLMVFDGFICF